jgi:hypothetical protein
MKKMSVNAEDGVMKIICASEKITKIALKYGWLPGANYNNLRNIKNYEIVGMIDIEWSNYNFKKHLEVVRKIKPIFTVAKDIMNINELDKIIDQAYELNDWCENVIIVPKDLALKDNLEKLIPKDFIFGYSIPTKYGSTNIPIESFKRTVHLLGGRPEIQRKLADKLNVASIDLNRIVHDAYYGDYFDGEIFRPHPNGGFYQCITDSIKNINNLWKDYKNKKVILERKQK